MKRRVVFLLCIITLSVCMSCGRTKNPENESEAAIEENLEDYSYLASYETIDSDWDNLFTCYCFQDDFLYFVREKSLPETQSGSYLFCRRKLEEGSPEEILFEKSSSEENKNSPLACAVFPDGRMVLCLSGYHQGQSYQMLQLLSPEGEEIYTVDITDTLSGDFPSATILKCITDTDENIYLLGRNQVFVYETGGTLLFSLSAKGEEFLNMGMSRDGTVFVTQRLGAGTDLSRIDVKRKGYSDACQGLTENIRGAFLAAGSNSAILLNSESGLCMYKPEKQVCAELLRWTDLGIESGPIKEIHMSEDGTIFLFFRNITEQGEQCQLCTLNRILKSEIPAQQTITIGTVDHSQLLDKAVAEFNKENPEYRIELLAYTEGLENSNSGDILYDAVQKLRLDILTGNAPDIIDFSQINLDYRQFMKKGFVEDLYAYIDGSEVLSGEDLVEPVLKAYETDGKLPCIPTAVYINSLAIKETLLDEPMSWTQKDCIALIKKQPADVQIMNWTTNSSILYTCMGNDESAYIDPVTGECSFDSEEFKEIMELASHFPNTPPDNEESASTAELLADNRLLFSNVFIRDFSSLRQYYVDFNGDLSFIGYPDRSGYGQSSFSGLNALGISSQSEHKEGAWLFIQSLFTKEMQTGRYAWGIPVLQSVYDEKLEAAMVPLYELDGYGNEILDENGNKTEVPSDSTSFDLFEGTYALTEREIEAFRELMKSTRKVAISGIGSVVSKIVEEEAMPYFEGQKSLDETVDIIQNRVQLYLRENM